MIKYAYTILYVNDVEASVKFYEEAFDFQVKFVTPEKDYGEIISGETTIAFASIALANTNLSSGFIESNPKEKPFGIELGFTTEQVKEVMNQAVSAGAEIYEEARTKPWGQTVGYLKDINGFLIEICTPMAAG